MKQLLLFALLISSTNLSAQDTTFSKIYEPVNGTLNFNEIPVTDADLVWDEGLITSGVQAFGDKAFIARISPHGDLIWQKELGSNLSDPEVSINQVITTTDSCFVVVGKTLDTLSGDYFPICMKFNAFGDTIWTRMFNLVNQPVGDFGTYSRNGAIVQNSDSTLIFGFHHISYNQSASNPDHLCLVEMTLDGNLNWSEAYETESVFRISSLKTVGDTALYVVGKTLGTLSFGFLINLSTTGQFQWAKKYAGAELTGLESDSSYLYCGWANDTYEGGIIKLFSNGTQVKRVRQTFEVNSYWREMSICRRSNGNIVSTAESPYSNQPTPFIEMDSNLNYINTYEPRMTMDQLVSIPNKGIYAIGYGPIFGVKSEYEEMGVVRFDSSMVAQNCVWQPWGELTVMDTVSSSNLFLNPSGTITTIQLPVHIEPVDFISDDGCVTFLGSVTEIEESWNETISPNPSVGAFTIDWFKYREVEITVYNSLGQQVYHTAVKHSFVDVDLGAEVEGIYFYQLRDSDGSHSSGKLVVIK